MSGIETLQIIPEAVANAAAFWIYVDALLRIVGWLVLAFVISAVLLFCYIMIKNSCSRCGNYVGSDTKCSKCGYKNE